MRYQKTNKRKSNPLRALARSQEYQTLYARAKDLGLKLFNNDKDLSRIQIIFLNYLELYSSLMQDITMNEPHIDYDKLKDDELVDAYLVWKRKNRENKNKKDKKEKKFNNTNIPSVVFSRGKRGNK